MESHFVEITWSGNQRNFEELRISIISFTQPVLLNYFKCSIEYLHKYRERTITISKIKNDKYSKERISKEEYCIGIPSFILQLMTKTISITHRQSIKMRVYWLAFYSINMYDIWKEHSITSIIHLTSHKSVQELKIKKEN